MKPSRSRKLFGMRFRLVEDKCAFDAFGWPPVFIRWDAAVFPALMTFPLWSRLSATGLFAAAIVGFALVLSILAHELGHAFAARWRGLEALRIDIDGTGGCAMYGGESISAKDERVIALAGPAANIAIGIALLGAYAALTWLGARTPDDPGAFHVPPPMVTPLYVRALLWIGAFNLALGVTNLFPAYPLDGAKLASQVLEARWGRDVALFWIGVSGVALATVSLIATCVFVLLGVFMRFPPEFTPNIDAIADSKWRPWPQRVVEPPPPPPPAPKIPDWLKQPGAAREQASDNVIPLTRRPGSS